MLRTGCAFSAKWWRLCSKVWERTRVGVRISPLGTFNDMGDANPEETFACVVDVLNGHRPGYLHVVEDAIDRVDQQGGLFPTLALGMEGDLCRQRRIRC